MERIKKLLLVSRPVSWLNTAYPFAIGYLVAGGQFNLTWFLGTLYFLIPYNLLMYGINDVFDYESDIRNPRKGGIEGMREQRAFHPTIVRAVLLTNLPFIVYFLLVDSWPARLVFAALLFMVVAYSLAGLRFKEVPVIDSITSSIHFVGPLVYALILVGSAPSAWWYVGAFFLWGMASHAVGAVQDIIPDRKGKLHSIATVFGARWTMRLSFLFYIVATGLVASQGGWAIAVALTGLLYAFNIVPYLNISDADSEKANTAWRRFIWLNFFTGFIVSVSLILTTLFR